jgi:hypothetical protein
MKIKSKLDHWGYNLSVAAFSFLAALFLCVLVTSVGKNVVDMMVRVGWVWWHPGNYVGLWAGFSAYGYLFLLGMPRDELRPKIWTKIA